MRVIRPPLVRIAAGLLVVVLAGGIMLAGSGQRLHAQSPGVTVTYPAGWNLISAPEGTVINGTEGPLYTFRVNDTNYETVPAGSPLHAGYGYWALFSQPTTVTLPAGSTAPLSGMMPRQFLMAGDPANVPAMVSLVPADAGANTYYFTWDPVGQMYTFSATPVTISPGQGIWVAIDGPNGGTLTLAPNSSATPVVSVPTATATGSSSAGNMPPATRFFGSVTVMGQAAAQGTPIVATSATGVVCGTTTVGAAPATSATTYALDITGADPSCTTPGSAISFAVGGAAATANPAATIQAGSGAAEADLTTP